MALLSFPFQQLQALCFIFLRVSAIFFWLPFFDGRNIPPLVKVGISFTLSLLLLPLSANHPAVEPGRPVIFLVGIISEIVMGICIGLSVKLLFTAIQFAGEVIGYQMGLAVANVFDPNTGGQESVIAHFNFLMAMLVFLTIDAHYPFFKALVDCFILIPPFGFQMNDSLGAFMIKMGSNMFIIALKIGAPLLVTLLFTSISLGLVARTVPQMNVFFVAMPIKIMIGFACIGFILPIFIRFLCSFFDDMADMLIACIRIIGG